MKRTLQTLLLLALVAIPMLATDLSGNWLFDGQARGRNVQLKMNLQQDGETLQGTVTGPRGKSFPIENGRVEGDAVSFRLGGEGGLGGAQVSGNIAGEKLPLTFKLSRGELKGTAARQN